MRTGDEIWALEILEAFEDQGICFLRISVLIDGGRRRYQIGIQREALLAIRSLKEIAVGTGGTLKEKR